jgi:hypothetical protein
MLVLHRTSLGIWLAIEKFQFAQGAPSFANSPGSSFSRRHSCAGAGKADFCYDARVA